MKINGSLVFDASSSSEIQNLRIQKVTSNPAATAADVGRIIYNTTDGFAYVGHDDGGSTYSWQQLAAGTAAQDEIDALEVSLGAGVGSDGTFNANGFTDVTGVLVDPTSFTNAINQLASAVNSNNELSELDDVTISSVANNDLLQYNNGTSKWVNRAIGSASGVQAYDAGLTSLGSLASTGIIVQSVANTFVARSLVAPSEGLSISNADGTGGNPTFALINDLSALESLSSTGFAVRSATDTWVQRSIAGTASNISVTNGDGVSGNPTINLVDTGTPVSASFVKITTDAKGRVSATTAVSTGDITGLVDSTYVNTSGDTMSGNLAMGNNKVTGLAAPSASGDAANKSYVDSAIAGLTWKSPARVATTANLSVTASGSGVGKTLTATGNGAISIDGVSLSLNDRVLVKNQTTASDNGIYYVSTVGTGGTPYVLTRATDFDSLTPIDEINSAAVFVIEGTVNADYGFTETAAVATLDTDDVVFAQFTGAAAIVPGVGLGQTGNTLFVNLGAGIFENPTDEVGIDLYNVSGNPLILTQDGSTRSTNTAAQLALLLNGSTLTQGSSGLKVADSGITATQIAAAVAGNGLAGGAGTALSVNVDDSTIEINSDTLRVKLVPIANGGTGQVTATAGFNALSPLTTKGDLVTHNGTNNIRKGVGTNGNVLSARSGQSDGLEYSKIYHKYSSGGSPSTSHTVTHGIGQQFCNVTVIDNADNTMVIPQSVTFNSTTVVVTFNTALDCTIVVMGVNTGA